jgi:hypothetical protein
MSIDKTKKTKKTFRRPITDEEAQLIDTYVYKLRNVDYCRTETGLHNETIKKIHTDRIGRNDRIKKVIDFCNMVKKATTPAL